MPQKIYDYHKYPTAGKIEIINKKPFKTQEDLSISYTPGVAKVCEEIHKNRYKSYEYTLKSNLVAVISNGTAVLGLGDIGAEASKPVMEGKAVLFKEFGKVDAIDIEIEEKDPDKFCEVVEKIAVTFGGINLEDIKAPECFEIEERLKKRLFKPVMHDDQHGTAIVTSAGLINALLIANKKIEDVKIVINGAGSAAIACGKLIKSMGAKHIYMCDSKGVLNKKRDDLNKYKKEFIKDTDAKTLKDIIKDADVFIGVSKGNILDEYMLKSMAKDPIVFAMANPTPEIMPDVAKTIRDDVIIATGRSDFNNQINNVLGFPYIFRGALDTRAVGINEEMKIAAVYAIANIAREESPHYLEDIYKRKLIFGRDYFIPVPFDKRLLIEVSYSVAKATIESGFERADSFDLNEYKKYLKSL